MESSDLSRIEHVPLQPMDLFAEFQSEAEKHQVPIPNVMCIATANK